MKVKHSNSRKHFPFSIIASVLLAIMLLVTSVPLPILTSSASSVSSVAYSYDAFGNLLAQTGTTENTYLYTGEQYDPNVGFYYLRARYYDTGVGRFVTTDPWQGNTYDPVTLHRYLYANNNPIMQNDPNGKSAGALAKEIVKIPILHAMAGIALLSAFSIGISVAILEYAKRAPVRLNHYTTWANLPSIMSKGFNRNPNYFSPDLYITGASAKAKLAMPQKPEIRINLTLYRGTDGLSIISVVAQKHGEPGQGLECFTYQVIPFWSRLPIVIPLFQGPSLYDLN